jgi:hypothetical protein
VTAAAVGRLSERATLDGGVGLALFLHVAGSGMVVVHAVDDEAVAPES